VAHHELSEDTSREADRSVPTCCTVGGSSAAVRYNIHCAGIERDIWANAREGTDFLWVN
jgi:hypothetical protein